MNRNYWCFFYSSQPATLCTSTSVAIAELPPPPNSPSVPTPLCPSRTTGNSLILDAADGELEDDALAGQFAVDLGVGVEAEVDAAALLLVEDDLEDLAAVLAGAGALADDLDGVDDVVEDGVMDGRQRPRVGPLLRLRRPRSIAAFGAGEDAARGQEEDVSVRELLLQFPRQAVGMGVSFFFSVACERRGGGCFLV